MNNCSQKAISLIPIAISFLSLVISIFVLIRDWWKERFNLKCEIVKWFASSVNNQPFYIWMIISNNSKLPITINKMELSCKCGDKILTAISRGEKHRVMSKTTNENTVDYYSCDYPICIDGYSGFGSYIHFTSNSNHSAFENQEVIITVYTNRGKKKAQMHLNYGDNIYRAMCSLSGKGKELLNSDESLVQYQYDGI